MHDAEDSRFEYVKLTDNRTSKSMAVPIPLPMDLPPAPDLSRLPSHIVHSGTVETLIGQNDDLMARLKVNIRRNSVLEQQIMEHERINVEMQRANGALMAQLQIVQEKDGIWKDKSHRSDQASLALREEIELLQTKLKSQEQRSRALKPAGAYQRRIRRWVVPLIDQLKIQLTSERKTVFTLQAALSDVRARLSDSVQHAQKIEAQTSRDQARLVTQYENGQKALVAELEALRTESKLYREKAARMESAVSAAAMAENRIVFLERQNQEQLALITSQHEEAQGLVLEAKKLMTEIDALKAAQKTNHANYERLQDQFETLQTIWADTEKRADAIRTQHETLNRLNQELSRQLKEQQKAPATHTATGTATGTAADARPSTDIEGHC